MFLISIERLTFGSTWIRSLSCLLYVGYNFLLHMIVYTHICVYICASFILTSEYSPTILSLHASLFLYTNPLVSQAVYLKQKEVPPQDFPVLSTKSLGPTVRLGPIDPTTDRADLITEVVDDKDDGEEGDDDDYISEGSGFENILQDMIPGVKVKVLKVTMPDKVDSNHISEVVEQIMEAEDDDEDTDLEGSDTEDDKDEGDREKNGLAVDSGGDVIGGEEQNQLAVKFVVGGLIQKFSGTARNNVSRVPARLEKKGRLSFRFTVDEDKKEPVSGVIGRSPHNTRTMLSSQKSIDHVMLDLAKSIGRRKIPMKVIFLIVYARFALINKH